MHEPKNQGAERPGKYGASVCRIFATRNNIARLQPESSTLTRHALAALAHELFATAPGVRLVPVPVHCAPAVPRAHVCGGGQRRSATIAASAAHLQEFSSSNFLGSRSFESAGPKERCGGSRWGVLLDSAVRTRESSSLYSRICSSLCNICNICASSSNFFSAAPPSECGRWLEGAVWWVALGMLPDSPCAHARAAASVAGSDLQQHLQTIATFVPTAAISWAAAPSSACGR